MASAPKLRDHMEEPRLPGGKADPADVRRMVQAGVDSLDAGRSFTDEEVWAELDRDHRAQCGRGLDEYGDDE